VFIRGSAKNDCRQNHPHPDSACIHEWAVFQSGQQLKKYKNQMENSHGNTGSYP
jgi:hypothetical protein